MRATGASAASASAAPAPGVGALPDGGALQRSLQPAVPVSAAQNDASRRDNRPSAVSKPKISVRDLGGSSSGLGAGLAKAMGGAQVTNQTQLLAQPKGAQAIQGQQGLARSGELFQAQGAPGTDHGHRQVMEAKGIPNLNMTRVKNPYRENQE